MKPEPGLRKYQSRTHIQNTAQFTNAQLPATLFSMNASYGTFLIDAVCAFAMLS